MRPRLRMTGADYESLHAHLFPGDRDEHAAILLAGRASRPGATDLLVREVHHLDANEFIPGRHGYRHCPPARSRALAPERTQKDSP